MLWNFGTAETDKAGKSAAQMRALIDALRNDSDRARAILLQAEHAGMEVSQAQFDLKLAIRDRVSEVHEALNRIHRIRAQVEGWEERARASDGGKRRTEPSDQKCRDGSGEERADGRSRERRSRPSLLCHLVTVESRDNRGSFSRKIDENRGRRAAVLRTIIDASQHNQRGHWRQHERNRQ